MERAVPVKLRVSTTLRKIDNWWNSGIGGWRCVGALPSPWAEVLTKAPFPAGPLCVDRGWGCFVALRMVLIGRTNEVGARYVREWDSVAWSDRSRSKISIPEQTL